MKNGSPCVMSAILCEVQHQNTTSGTRRHEEQDGEVEVQQMVVAALASMQRIASDVYGMYAEIDDVNMSQSLKLICHILCLFYCVFYLVHISTIDMDVTPDMDHDVIV